MEATYDEAFGGDVGRGVRHTRAVLFIKPDFWVMLDRMEAVDGKEHLYEPLFHFDGPVKMDGLRVRTQNTGEANLTLLARGDAGLDAKIVEGQQEPVQGWLTKTISSVRPAPVAVYQARGKTVNLMYVMAPSRAGAGDLVRGLEGVAGDPLAGRVVMKDGRVAGQAVSDAFGEFKVDHLEPNSGAYTLHVRADGKPEVTKNVEISDSLYAGVIAV